VQLKKGLRRRKGTDLKGGEGGGSFSNHVTGYETEKGRKEREIRGGERKKKEIKKIPLRDLPAERYKEQSSTSPWKKEREKDRRKTGEKWGLGKRKKKRGKIRRTPPTTPPEKRQKEA